MTAQVRQTISPHAIVRWTARTLSLLSAAVLLLFLGGGEQFDLSRLTPREWTGLLLFPGGIIAGFAIAWWKEGLGGAVTMGSLLAFYVIYGWVLHGRIGGWWFFVFASPGVLFLLSDLLRRNSNRLGIHGTTR